MKNLINVHLALEHVCKSKHLIKAPKITLKHVPRPQIYLEGSVNKFGPGTCTKLISISSNQMFYSKYMIKGQMHIMRFFSPSNDMLEQVDTILINMQKPNISCCMFGLLPSRHVVCMNSYLGTFICEMKTQGWKIYLEQTKS